MEKEHKAEFNVDRADGRARGEQQIAFGNFSNKLYQTL